MKETGIIMTAESVRGILDDSKTQTRRVVRVQPPSSVTDIIASGWGFVAAYPNRMATKPFEYSVLSPFGRPGDRLWVRESFRAWATVGAGTEVRTEFKAGGFLDRHIEEWSLTRSSATEHWRPSIHMPRWASRITLEVTGIRVQRLQQISGDDVVAEGVRVPVSEKRSPLLQLSGKHAPCTYPPFNGALEAIKAATSADWLRAYYASLWDGLNAKRGYGWRENPWVWVIEFRRVDA